MRILMINKYLWSKGGAETYVIRLGEQLQRMGHEVQYFGMEHPRNQLTNRAGAYTRQVDFHNISLPEKLRWGLRVIYSREARVKLRQVLEDFQPEVCHLNNFHYQLTPSILLEIRRWSRQRNIPCSIVYTAHDYQLICPNHMCYDGSAVCRDCLGGRYGSCVRKACIHGSRLRSLLGALEGAFWRHMGIYRQLDTILCCSDFLKRQLEKDPLLQPKCVTFPNFSPLPEAPRQEVGDYVLYFGRLSPEKGIHLLLEAAKALPQIPFVFAGEGELAPQIQALPNGKFLGYQSGEALTRWVRGARFTVLPSVWYENCPFSVLESLSHGVPVLGADIGGIPELIRPGITGSLFTPGDPKSLQAAIVDLWEHPLTPLPESGISLEAYAALLQEYYRPGGKVSVVVPVYNTAPYLDRCVQSILHQSHRDLEILLIDDGSTDGSGEICDRWAASDSRIRVIHQENAGLGMARNRGIEAATGEAICFVDSDDFLLPQTIAKTWTQLHRKQAEAVIFGMCWEGRENRPITGTMETYRGAQVREVFLPRLLRQEQNLPISSCTALYSMDLVRRARWRFPSERQIIAEDVYALLQLYGAARSVVIWREPLYVYCQTRDSLTRRYRPDRFAKLKDFYIACQTLCREQGYCDEVSRSCAAPFLGILIGCMKQEAARGNRQAVRSMVSDPLVQQALEETNERPGWKKRLLYFAMVRCPGAVWPMLLAQNRAQKEGIGCGCE